MLAERYSYDQGREIIQGNMMSDSNKDTVYFGMGNYKEKRQFAPYISEIDIDTDNVKSVFISNSYLYKSLGKNVILKMLCKGMMNEREFQREKIGDVAEKLLALYIEYCKRRKKSIEEADFMII